MDYSSELLLGAEQADRVLPERARAEVAWRQSEARYRTMVATMEQGFCLLEKVATTPDEPSDYRYLTVNAAFARHTGLLEVVGKTIRQVVPEAERSIIALYDGVLASGEPCRIKEYVTALDLWLEAEVLPDPQPGHLLVLFSNVSARHQAEQTLRQSAVRQSYLLALSDALRPVRDAATVQATTTHTALHYFGADRCYYGEVEGDTVTIRRDAARPGLPSVAAVYSLSAMPIFGQLPQGNAPVIVADVATSPAVDDSLRQRCLSSHIRAYINVPVVRHGERVGMLCLAQRTPREWTALEVALMQETAERTWAAVERTQALQESRDLLHAVAESQTVRLSAFKAVRDEQDQLIDLACIFTNARAGQLGGGWPVVGQPYLQQFSESERTRLLDAYRRIMATGQAEEQEVAHPQGAQMGWFRTISTKLGDGVLVSEEDITARRQAEHERAKALRLLEQSEAVANMGSWDYELATGRMTWSAGMYRLYGLAPGHPAPPPHYLDFALEEDRLIAERLMGSLQAGTTAFEETLRLQVGSDVKTVCVQAMLLPGEDGRPGRVLGVDLDISTVQRLEAENQALRLGQQQALVLAILQAQEAERNRLAESLHNGLGQILYAIKLQLSQLDVPELYSWPALAGVRSHVDRLLSDAINQTRTLAHELMPTTLAEQGLGPALRDICRSLTTPQLQFTCQLWLDAQVLPPPLQTAVYRLAQELAHNVAKHAEASHAVLEFEMMPGWVSLRAEDNGRGFDPTAMSKGLGMRLLHDAVGLLGGTMRLDSSPEYGTHIRLRIPIIP